MNWIKTQVINTFLPVVDYLAKTLSVIGEQSIKDKEENRMIKIMIDIGHGGYDTGAVANGHQEKDLNLSAGIKLKDWILKKYDNVEVRLSRESDISLTPDQRVEIVNDFDPNICLSIHHNGFSDPSVSGAEIIHAHYDKYDDELADNILDGLVSIGMPKKRMFSKLNDEGKDYYYMIRKIWDTNTRALIIEFGFITNALDAAFVSDEMNQVEEARVVAEALAAFLGLQEKKISTVPEWQENEFSEFAQLGILSNPQYWEGKLDKAITGGELFAILNKLYEEILENQQMSENSVIGKVTGHIPEMSIKLPELTEEDIKEAANHLANNLSTNTEIKA